MPSVLKCKRCREMKLKCIRGEKSGADRQPDLCCEKCANAGEPCGPDQRPPEGFDRMHFQQSCKELVRLTLLAGNILSAYSRIAVRNHTPSSFPQISQWREDYIPRLLLEVDQVQRLAQLAETVKEEELAKHAYDSLVEAVEVITLDEVPRWSRLGQLLVRAQEFFLRIRNPLKVKWVLDKIISKWPSGEAEIRRDAWHRYHESQGIAYEICMTGLRLDSPEAEANIRGCMLPRLHIPMREGAGQDVIVKMIDQTLEEFLHERDERNRSPLFVAAELRMEEVGHALIRKISHERRQQAMDVMDIDGNTLLGIAISSNCSGKFINTLISEGAQIPPEHPIEGQASYWELASLRGDPAIIGLLGSHVCIAGNNFHSNTHPESAFSWLNGQNQDFLPVDDNFPVGRGYPINFEQAGDAIPPWPATTPMNASGLDGTGSNGGNGPTGNGGNSFPNRTTAGNVSYDSPAGPWDR